MCSPITYILMHMCVCVCVCVCVCIGIVKAMVFPVATHGYERWTVKKSVPHGTFSRIDHILGHKSSLGKFKKTEIIPVIFSDHSAVRLDLNYRGKETIKNSNI